MLGLKAKDEKGEVVASPSLELVLSYEAQVRKLMTKKMNEGINMAIALEEAMQDTTVKERYFLTPAALNAAARRDDVRLKSRSPKRALTPVRDALHMGSGSVTQKERAKEATRESEAVVDVPSTHAPQTAGIFASHGTTKTRDAASSVEGFTVVRFASEITPHIPAVETRKTMRKMARTRRVGEEDQPPSEVAVPQRSS